MPRRSPETDTGTATGTSAPDAPDAPSPAGKGRPTPTRKQAQADARARARTGLDSKASRKQQREKRAELARKQRQGMKDGDERFLLKRDKGPVKRFVRDFVDARLSLAELLLPILLVSLLLNSAGSAELVRLGGSLMTTAIIVVAADTAFAVWRMKRQLRAALPEESHKGVTFYAVMRMLQIRPTRIPKARVKIGGRPKSRA